MRMGTPFAAVWRTCIAVLLVLVAVPATAGWLFVGPDGSDGAAGRSAQAPLATVQQALEFAYPGDTVVLLPGTYHQDIRSVRAGRAGAPIRIQGPPDAVVKGAGDSHVIDIQHDYLELVGFTVDGLHGDGDALEDYRDKLVYVHGRNAMAGIAGIRILGMSLTNAFGECLRIKTHARDNEVAYSRIDTCGVRDFRFGRGRKNGEGIYVGTAPEQLPGGQDRLDRSVRNHIHHNFIRPEGSECVDIKEGADRNVVEHNVCMGLLDPDSGGINVRGNSNIIRDNVVGPSVGAGIRLGGDTEMQGIGNWVYGNQLQYNEAGSLKLMRLPQALVCGNEIRQPASYPKVRFGGGMQMPVLNDCPPGRLPKE